MVSKPLWGEVVGEEEQTSSCPGSRGCVQTQRSPRCFPEEKVLLRRPLGKEPFH